MPSPTSRYVFIHSRFPCLSETFVATQAEALIRMGMSIEHISNHRPTASEVHPQHRPLSDQVFYLETTKPTDMLLALFSAMPLVLRRWRSILHTWRSSNEPKASRIKHLLGALVVLNRFSHAQIHVHAHFTYGAAAVARWCHVIANVPYSLTLHGADVLFDDPPDLEAKLRNAKALVSISDKNFNAIRSRFGERTLPSHCEVIPLGVTPQPYEPPLAIENEFRILHVGRLNVHKAQHVLVEACAELKAQHVKFVCDIVGSGELEHSLKALITTLGLTTDVRLLGSKYHSDVLKMYRQYHVFVLTSIVEGMPTVIMEAMNAGVPVVATDVGGTRELVQDTAILVPPGNPTELARTLLGLAKGSVDTAALTHAAHKRIEEHYDLRRNEKRFARFLHTLPISAPR